MVNLILLTSFAFARDLDKLYTKAKFTLGTTTVDAYVADDDQRRAQGLMHIERLAPDQGMLFVFDQPQVLSFWMKNTLMPLQIGFFDTSCRLIDRQEMDVAKSVFATPPSYQSRGDAILALEMTAGWFTRHGVDVGALLKLKGDTHSKLLRTALSRCK